MSQPRSGGLWARLMSLGRDKEEKSVPAAPVPTVNPDGNGASVVPTAIETAERPATPARQDSAEMTDAALRNSETPVGHPTNEQRESPQDDALVSALAELEETPFDFAEAPAEPLPPPLFPFETLPPGIPAEPMTAPPKTVLPPSDEEIAAPAPEPGDISAEPAPPTVRCPCCQATAQLPAKYCAECGYCFPADAAVTLAVSPANPSFSISTAPIMSKVRIKDRYELREMTGELLGIRRYKGLDVGNGRGQPVPVTIVTAAIPDTPVLAEEAAMVSEEEEILPGFDNVAVAAPILEEAGNSWPSLAWEKSLLEKVNHPGLPSVRDYFVDGNAEYLIEEVPQGRSLWDAWDEPESSANVRYGWLRQIADVLLTLTKAGAIIEGIRPDIIVIDNGKPRITDLADLLSLPLQHDAPVRASLYTAPELILTPDQADGRSQLYSLGAMLYALEYLHHGLEEKDFERQFVPHQVTDRFPDVHPLFPRLLNKSFVREVALRFPSDEMTKADPTGLMEFMRCCDVAGRTLDQVRLDIAAWTTTGMVRTGNEDAFTLLHAVDARLDDIYEYSMVLLADGMGGYEAGEVAAAMALAELKKYLLQQPVFAGLTGKTMVPPVNADQVQGCKDVLKTALKHANKEVFTFSRTPGKGKRTMGCTAEVVYVDGHNVIVGHVGDSRTYHLHQGRLIQLTRDQTLVNRLVELGQLTPEEAENHDRKNELQQAVGAQPDVDPGLYHGRLKRGDWVLVCSDGLINHVTNSELEKMLMREAAGSAEDAARRLVNLANLRGATDNTTVVVIRAT